MLRGGPITLFPPILLYPAYPCELPRERVAMR